MGARKVVRSAVSGRFVEPSTAKSIPKTTGIETVKSPPNEELRRLELLADQYIADLVAEVGPPTAEQHARAAAIVERLVRRPTRKVG